MRRRFVTAAVSEQPKYWYVLRVAVVRWVHDYSVGREVVGKESLSGRRGGRSQGRSEVGGGGGKVLS